MTTGKGTCGEACHATLFNPLGYAFENYDAIGKYRTMNVGKPVNAADSYIVRRTAQELQERRRAVTSPRGRQGDPQLLRAEHDELLHGRPLVEPGAADGRLLRSAVPRRDGLTSRSGADHRDERRVPQSPSLMEQRHEKPENAFKMNRRMVLRGAGGLMLGLPLLETFMPRKASAQTGDALAVRHHRGGRQRRGPGGCDPGRRRRAGEVLADGERGADQGQHARRQGDAVHGRAVGLRRQAPHRPRRQPALQLDRLLAFGGGCADPHRREDHAGQHQLRRPWGSRSTPRSPRSRIRPGATRSCSTQGCSPPAGPASTSRATSRTSLRSSRACTSTRHTRRTRRSSARSGMALPAPSAEAQAQMQRAARSKSINDILRPQIQALLGAAGSQQERPRPARSAPHRHPRHRGEDLDHDVHDPGRGRRRR